MNNNTDNNNATETKPARSAAVLTGNLGQDPESITAKSGKSYCAFTLAEDIEGTEEPKWHTVLAFGETAAEVMNRLKKGSRVTLKGRRETDVSIVEGETRTYHKFIMDDSGFTVAD